MVGYSADMFLLLMFACGSVLPSDSQPAGGDDTEPAALEGCQDPTNWNLGGNGRYCEGSCGSQAIVCADTMSPPQCRVGLADGGHDDCDIPEGEDEALCETAIVTTCAALIVP